MRINRSIVPAKVDIISHEIRNLIELAFRFQRVKICTCRETIRVERFDNAMQCAALLVHIWRILEHCDLILDAPAEDGWVVDVLKDQIRELLLCVFKQSRVLRHFQHRDLGPDE